MSNLENNRVLEEFYGRGAGVFEIPLLDVNKEVTLEILKFLKKGHLLGLVQTEIDTDTWDWNAFSYVIFDKDVVCSYYLSEAREFLGFKLGSYTLGYFESFPVEKYPKYADVVDDVLLSSTLRKNQKGYFSICLTIEGSNFVFKEAELSYNLPWSEEETDRLKDSLEFLRDNDD